MTPIEKAKWLSEFYAAIAEGKTAQVQGMNGKWIDCHTVDYWPGMGSALNSKHEWRIKPEPQRRWTCNGEETANVMVASKWRTQGFQVTEWLEVV